MAARGGHGGRNLAGVGKRRPSRTDLARVGGDVQWAGWRVSGRRGAVRLGVAGLAIVPGRD